MVFHRSGRNVSNVTRYTLVGRYHAADDAGFRIPAPEYRYRGLTPKQYHDEMMATVRR